MLKKISCIILAMLFVMGIAGCSCKDLQKNAVWMDGALNFVQLAMPALVLAPSPYKEIAMIAAQTAVSMAKPLVAQWKVGQCPNIDLWNQAVAALLDAIEKINEATSKMDLAGQAKMGKIKYKAMQQGYLPK